MSRPIFAEVGSSFAQSGGSCPAGWIVMEGERPSPEHVAQADGSWIIPPTPVPEVVTMRQARIALSRAGLISQVEQALTAMEGQAGEEARIEWDYSSEVHRSKPFVVGLGAAIGLTDAEINDLFITASGIA